MRHFERLYKVQGNVEVLGPPQGALYFFIFDLVLFSRSTHRAEALF